MTEPIEPTMHHRISDPAKLAGLLSLPGQLHQGGSARYVLQDEARHALRLAWIRRRPLLVVGEAGMGKSQLAAAVAQAWGVPLLTHVIQSTTQADDLLWQIDAVERLAEAQVAAVASQSAQADWKAALAPERFVRPGVLWWAWRWASLAERINSGQMRAKQPAFPSGWQPAHGCVVLLDEIDKAPPDLPNNLLDVLESGSFALPWSGERETLSAGTTPPLIVITSNGDRELPAPFLRRCFRLPLVFGGGKAPEVWLRERAEAHFGEGRIDAMVLEKATEQILQDRAARGAHTYRAGVSEFLDLLYAVTQLASTPAQQLKLLDELGCYVLKYTPTDTPSSV